MNNKETTSEYEQLMEHAPQIRASGLDGDYPVILEVSPLYESEGANEMAILCLPMAEKQLEHAITRCEIESFEQLRFNPSSALLQMLRGLPALECESLSDLNKMCQAIMPLDIKELSELSAAICSA